MRKGTEKTYLILHGWESSHAAMQYQICFFYNFSHLFSSHLFLWYSDCGEHIFFLNFKDEKSYRKNISDTAWLHGYFPAMQDQICLFCTFSHLRNLTKCVQRRVTNHKDSNMFCRFNKVKPC